MTENHPLKMPLVPGDPMTDEQLAAFLDFDDVAEMIAAAQSYGSDDSIETLLSIQTCTGQWLSSNQIGALWHFYDNEAGENSQ